MAAKRQPSEQAEHHFSCQSCHDRKLKCFGGTPCHHCARLRAVCTQIEPSNKRRKQRFPEAELLAKIKRYEKVLLASGVDLLAINRRADGQTPPNNDLSIGTPTPHHSSGSSVDVQADTSDQGDLNRLLTIIDGEHAGDTNARVEKVFYSRFYQDDGSSLFTAPDTAEVPVHPAPFDIFKLWQIYCDNVHPICKLLHAPTFQRKISAHGLQLHMAPAADQALLFGMYLAAIVSLSEEECQSSFKMGREVLLKQYQRSAQTWLHRAGFWRTLELDVLQAFVLYLHTQQHFMDPRALVTFTGMADRLARRMGLHVEHPLLDRSLLEQEVGKRVWWELLFLDARTVEKAGMGNLDLKGTWTTTLLDGRSDADLEGQQKGEVVGAEKPPSSEMIFVLARSAAARCQTQLGHLASDTALSSKLDMIGKMQRWVETAYLSSCSMNVAQHRLAKGFFRMATSRMKIAVYLVEEARESDAGLSFVRQDLLKLCISNLKDFINLRGDAEVQRFMWLLYVYMPIYVYIHLLRLLQLEVIGHLVDKAWQVLEEFRSQGASLQVDMLVMRAWRARQAGAVDEGVALQVPKFVQDIIHSQPAEEATFPQPDYMVMLADIMAGNTDYDFDWSAWLSHSPAQ